MSSPRHGGGTTVDHSWCTPLAWAIVAVGLVLGQAAAARAASFSVNPTQVFLSSSVKSALVSIKNETDQPVRFQMTVMAWDQDPSGQMQLTATQDVVFFPALLTLKSHEERKVRVGVTVAPGAVEKTYRLFVEELPPLETGETPTGVAMRTKMGIPVFLRPAAMTARAGFQDLTVRGGHFAFRLQNSGTVHFVPESVRVRGLDATGGALMDQRTNAWYVLAGGSRAFDIELPAAQCGQIRTLAVEAQISGTTVKEMLQTPGGACGK
jgi:fimbrial chaperone protein